MPARILLADKSITIQKVVEMLFSSREYEVVCVSDGDTALTEAERVVPDVVLADVDLPRVDGYNFAARLKKITTLAQTPVILMMSRDDVYDTNKGKQAGIFDNIAKPFESQELIGKVKKALVAAPPRLSEPVTPRPEVAAPPQPVAAASRPATPVAPSTAKAKAAAPADIFDIISEAPTQADIQRSAVPPESESVYEVEPVVEEVGEPLAGEMGKALPIGAKAVEEMRAGLGLTKNQEEPQPEIVTFESFDMALEAAEKTVSAPPSARPDAAAPPPMTPPSQSLTLSESEMRAMAEETIAKMAKDVFASLPPIQPPTLSESDLRTMAEGTIAKMAKDVFANLPPVQPPTLSRNELRSIAEETISKMAKDVFAQMPPVPPPPSLPESELRGIAEETVSRMAREIFKDMTPPVPKISQETVRRGIEEAVSSIAREIAREVIEKVAWEVVPELAENLITAEIERLKTKT